MPCPLPFSLSPRLRAASVPPLDVNALFAPLHCRTFLSFFAFYFLSSGTLSASLGFSFLGGMLFGFLPLSLDAVRFLLLFAALLLYQAILRLRRPWPRP
ncbi:hypothetical protein BJV78DRAFT_1214596, partial [Lactifluus subvellereus]